MRRDSTSLGDVMEFHPSLAEAGDGLAGSGMAAGIERETFFAPFESPALSGVGMAVDQAEISQCRAPVRVIGGRRKEPGSPGMPRPSKVNVGPIDGIGPAQHGAQGWLAQIVDALHPERSLRIRA